MIGLTNRQAAERLRCFEDEHRLFAFSFDGWSPWRVLRRTIHNELVALPLTPLNIGSRWARVRQALAATVTFARHLAFPPRCDVVLKSFASALREAEGDRFRDVYFDSLLDMGLTAFRIEVMNNQAYAGHSRRAIRRAQLDASVFDFWGRVMATLAPSPPLAGFCQMVTEAMADELNLRLDPNRLTRMVASVYWQSRLYAFLLWRLRPRAVLVADTAEYPLLRSCQRLGIRFIELQHGLFDRDHPDAVPAGPDREPAKLLLPDILAVYGHFWKQQLAGLALPQSRIVPVGCDAIDRARANRLPTRNGQPLHLVVTTQGVDRENLVEWLLQAVLAAPVALKWRMTIKLHPGYDTSPAPYARLSEHERIEIFRGSDPPNTQDLLASADWHLSISSACHFEALGLGVPTIVIPLRSSEAVGSIVDDIVVHRAETPAAIWAIVAKPRSRAEEFDKFYQPNFVDNIAMLIPPNNASGRLNRV